MSLDKEDEVGFNAQKWVWFPDESKCFDKGFIVEDNHDDKVTVQSEQTGNTKEVTRDSLQKVNPPKFDKCDNMASLTFLNEPSVLHNLRLRYEDDAIYTYSGLFLVGINPYKELNIYSPDFIRKYHNTNEDSDTPSPHIFGITEQAFQNLIQDNKDQSILVTGESGAGKTENTKKIIQYLTSITRLDNAKTPNAISESEDFNFEQKILEANPILESFGNSQTLRNNNSSRFGKFIKLDFNPNTRKLVGANIEWYLLEKSRVVHQDSNERNYHIFYQLLLGLSEHELKLLGLKRSVSNYNYLKNGNHTVAGVDDKKEFKHLIDALKTVNLELKEIANVFKVLAIILLLGNIEFVNGDNDKKQLILKDASSPIDQLCKLLEISDKQQFVNSLIKPRVKAGKEFVTQQRTPKQAKFAIDLLSKSLYEKVFEYIVDKINSSFISGHENTAVSKYIGILDIAGFEIFTKNSFEQLCINYTNEKLQQFFNHHMFVLEQNEYLKENINWKFIDFGNDLIPTIELIEEKKKNQLGIFAILDEECIVPNSSDKSLFEKLNANLESKDKKIKENLKFRPNKNRSGFIIKHYAGEVEYDIEGWLDKNRDPLSDSIVEVIHNQASNLFVKNFYRQEAEQILKSQTKGSNKKSSMLRTVASRHKSQLSDLMSQLGNTNPHFVRCILPNNQKRQGNLDNHLVLHQLRCNGVLEGIRIARAGFPNRIVFAEFFERYKLLCKNQLMFSKSQTNSSMKQNCELILGELRLDPEIYKVGGTKLFFKNGVLAELEKKREHVLEEIMTKVQALIRGKLNRNTFKERLLKLQASQVIVQNFNQYNEMKSDPWFSLFVKLKPLLESSDTAADQKVFKEKIKKLKTEIETLKKENDSILSENKKFNVQVEEVNDTLVLKRQLLETKEEELQTLKKHEIELERMLSAKVEELKKIKEQLDDMIEENKTLKSQLTESNLNLESGEKSVKDLSSERDSLQTKIKKLETTLESTKKQHTQSVTDSSTLTQEIKMLKGTLKDREAKIKSLEDAINTKTKSLESKLANANNDYKAATAQLREAINEKDDLQRQLSKLKSSNNSVDTVIKLKEEQLKSLNKSILLDKSKITEIEQEKSHIHSKYETVKKQLVQANEELKKLSNKHQKLQHDLAQSKTLLDAKIEDDVKFGRGKQVHDRDLLDLKETIIDLRDKLTSNYGNNSELETNLKALKYENDQLLKMKKKFDIKIAELTFQLRNRPTSFTLDNTPNDEILDDYSSLRLQLNESTLNSTRITLENKHMREELSLLQTRLASESYENRQLKLELKKLTGDSRETSPSLDNRYSFSSYSDKSSSSREATELRLQLETERRANKRIEALNISLQKEMLQYKNLQYRPEKRLSGLGSSEDSGEYENDFYKERYLDAQAKISSLESQLRDSNGAQPLKDTTQSVLNSPSKASKSLVHSENLRLNAKLNELNAQLKRAKYSNESSTLRKEESDNLRARLEVMESNNADLSSSVQLYKSRADEYYSKLELADVAVKASKRAEEMLKREKSEMKKALDLLQKESKLNDNKIVKLHSEIRDLEQNLSDLRFENRKLQMTIENLTEKYSIEQELRSSTSSAESLSHELELRKLSDELSTRMNHETEMGKTIKYLSLELDETKKLASEHEQRVYELSKSKSHLEKEVDLLTLENDKMSIRQKEMLSKMETLISQVSALRAINEDIIMERDQLLETKRSLEAQVQKVTSEFDRYLLRNNEDIENKVTVNEIQQELSKSRDEKLKVENKLQELQRRQDKVLGEYNSLKQDSITMIEENKLLTKFNKKLVEKQKQSELKFKETIEQKDKSWQERVEQLEEKINQINESKINEEQKLYNLNKLSKDLKFKYEEQLYLVSRYRKENDELDLKLEEMNKEVENLRKQETKSSLKIKRTERQLDEYKENCLNLEKELLNWKSTQV